MPHPPVEALLTQTQSHDPDVYCNSIDFDLTVAIWFFNTFNTLFHWVNVDCLSVCLSELRSILWIMTSLCSYSDSSPKDGFSRTTYFLNNMPYLNAHCVHYKAIVVSTSADDSNRCSWIPARCRMPMSWFEFSASINVWWGLIPSDPPYCCIVEGELIVRCHSRLPIGNQALIQGLWYMPILVACLMGDWVAHISPVKSWTLISVLQMFMGSH